ncbi:hypothetical protein EVAR_2334_1 [Eumeta japonica]|uniref:Reverse transcriptase domain-containing protein n=1 Tax=Eumeta variegata TaxID=151549 RepID=A0A4C1SFY1_EUMVA|nr:hypothetical protein EVAR_2334_1 [Eumeta japonica]
MITKVNDSVKTRGMKVNVRKTKIVVFERGGNTTECDIYLEGESVEQVKEFVYLGCLLSNYGLRTVVKIKFGGRKMKVESKLWRCDHCVVCVKCLKDKCRNSDVRERCGLKKDVVTRIKNGELRRFDHLEKMNEID